MAETTDTIAPDRVLELLDESDSGELDLDPGDFAKVDDGVVIEKTEDGVDVFTRDGQYALRGREADSDDPETLDLEETHTAFSDYMDALGGELDTLALLQDLYFSDEVSVPWSTYILPERSDEMSGKTVVDTFRHHQTEIPDDRLFELYERVEAERERRR